MCPGAFLSLIAHAVCALALAGLLVTGLPARAQTAAAIADPTQPAGSAVVSPGAAATRGSRAAAGPAAPAVWPKLQSVQVGDNGSASAMIDGRIVHVGDVVGPLTLVAIDAQGVLLRGARFEQRLALLPGIEKTASAEPVAQPLAAAAPLARSLRGRVRAAAVASIAPSPAAQAAPAVPSYPAGPPLKLDLQIDTPAPDTSVAPAALAQAPTKDFR